MRHMEIRATIAHLVEKELASKDAPFDLYPFQQETLNKFVGWLRRPQMSQDEKLWHRVYVDQATGLGKTAEFSRIIRAVAGKARVLVIVPTRPLVIQTVRSIAKSTKGRLGHISTTRKILDDNDEVISLRGYDGHDIVVTTDESFKARAQDIANVFDPDLIIWDECHWAYTEFAQAALDCFQHAVIVGFSATTDFIGTVAKADYVPVTLDNGQVLYGDPARFAKTYFGECLDQRGVRWGIENGYLSSFAWGRIDFKVSLKGVPTVRTKEGIEDYDEVALHKLLGRNWKSMMKVVCKLYESEQYDLKKRSAVAICPGVKEAQDLARRMNRLGVRSACVHGGTSDEERNAIFKAYELGTIKLITSVFVLREGWDMPRAEVCLMLRPTKSRVLYVQFIGRVLRLFGGNPDKISLILDAMFQDMEFAPLSTPVLFGLPGQEVRNGEILIRPRQKGGRQIVSPYQIDRLTPVLVIERPELDYWAGEDGIALIAGVRYSLVKSYADSLSVKYETVQRRIDESKLVGRPLKDVRGQKRLAYTLTELNQLCADLVLAKAEADDIIDIGGVKYISVPSYADRKNISAKTVQRRVEKNALKPEIARDKSGHQCPFYPLNVLERICTDCKPRPTPLKPKTRVRSSAPGRRSLSEEAVEKGTMIGEDLCMTCETYADLRKLKYLLVARCVLKAKTVPKRIVRSKHKAWPLYAEKDLDRVCAGLLSKK